MNSLFISYRRQDSASYSIRLRENLTERYGAEQVFFDFADLAPGLDFVQELHRVVEACTVMLVVIGPKWVSATDASGRRRVDDPSDFIRTEVATALRSGKQVVPVLVGGASMPRASDLPTELQPLARRNAASLADRTWTTDLPRLYEDLDPLLGTTTPKRAARLSFLSRLAAAFDNLRGRSSEKLQTAPSVQQPIPGAVPTAPESLAPVRQPASDMLAEGHEVFVSYASDDRAHADSVVEALEQNGHVCWVSHRNIPAGTPSWAGAIVEAIAGSRIVVVVVTGHSIASKQVLREVTLADAENIPLIPLCVDDTPLSKDLKYFFASAQRLDAATMPWVQAMHSLEAAVSLQL